MRSLIHYLLILTCIASNGALAAPVATPLNPVADLTQEIIEQQVEQKIDKQPEKFIGQSLSMTSQELLQHPEILENALNLAVEQQNIPNIRFLLPLYQKLDKDKKDEVLVLYAQAMLYRADGKYSKAQEIFSQLLQEHPNYAPIRLQYALSLSQDNQLKEAQNELQVLHQTPDLPEYVTQNLVQFDQYLQQKQNWQFNGNVYYLSEKNVNNAPKQRTYGYWIFPEPHSAHGLGYELSAQKTIPLKKHWAARVNSSLYGKFYWDAHNYDDLNARIEVGGVWRNHQQEVSLQPFFEKRWYGTQPYSKTVGGVLRTSRIISPNVSVSTALQSGYKKHDDRSHLDGATHSVSTSMLYRTSPQQYFVLGLGIGYESAHDKSDAYTNGYARANWTRKWKNLDYLETSVSATIQKKNYQSIDLFNIKRNDTEYFTRLSLNHPKLSWHGFVPNLNWTWGHTDSNHFYYRKKNENKVFIDIAKQF